MSDNQNRIFVNLRVRPRNEREKKSELLVNYDLQDPKVLNLSTGKTYGFDAVYYDSVTQKGIFNNSVKPVMKNIMSGYQSAILCYGQTGSGKTHTMRGKDHDPDLQGIIPRVARYIYEEKAMNPSVEVKIAYVQLYLGKPRDLLNFREDVHPEFRIIEDELEFVGVTWETAENYTKFMKLADGADTHKVVRATAMNPESSRGHSAMVIDIKKSANEGGVASIQEGKLFLVDLAGYEQAALIGTDGMLQQETKHINETLLGLNRVMAALARKEKRIPYREYKLTMMLKDALSTKTRSLVFCTMSPALEYKQQSMNTLYFGQSGMSVKVKATLSVVSDWKGFAQGLQQVMGSREDRIRTMKAWFEKVSPKEMALYEEQFGKIEDEEVDEGSTDIDDVVEKFASVAHDKMAPADPDETDDVNVDDIDGIDPNDKDLAKRIEMKLLRRKKRAEHDFEKEIAILKAQQAEEIEEMRKMGRSEEEIALLEKEHQFEIKMRTDAHWDSMAYNDEKVDKVKGTVSLGVLARLKSLSPAKKVKTGLASPTSPKSDQKTAAAAQSGSPRSLQLSDADKSKLLSSLDGAMTKAESFIMDSNSRQASGGLRPAGSMRRVGSGIQRGESMIGAKRVMPNPKYDPNKVKDTYKEIAAMTVAQNDPEFQEFSKMYSFFKEMKLQEGAGGPGLAPPQAAQLAQRGSTASAYSTASTAVPYDPTPLAGKGYTTSYSSTQGYTSGAGGGYTTTSSSCVQSSQYPTYR
jgi:hypothetical protein|eukprot:CAMPEP_0174300722 /NCGR_PEP_ID=MMETSP0809-20121228/58626_1 /TAXON_ID=73025 ORGANISM="Eutreptiella gymnastica-like, Strain CCMP1594" /NCGR_SAMPLE_ID=MMETSP0809 /ASSEMBLY_ACC=CAM_ASM_000658 /LENGTH=748 /DNA_ID=CAMNT_0015406349 /DNA_START=27 /DNA_END=2273 /DNA_ORIENTATION=-